MFENKKSRLEGVNESTAEQTAKNEPLTGSNSSININVSQESEKDFSYLSFQAVKNVEKFNYHIKRGLTNETLRRFGCGYLPPGTKAGNTKLTKWWWLFFPTGNNLKSGNARFIGDKDFRNFGGKDIFNFQALNSEIVIVVESEICAMTIYQETDAPVVALSGTPNTKKFIKHVENLDHKPRIIIVLTDNDGSYGEDGERPSKGKGAAVEIIEAFNKLNIFTFDAIKFLNDCKDPNEFFLKYGAQKFKERIELILNRADLDYTKLEIESENDSSQSNDQSDATSQDDFDSSLCPLPVNEIRYPDYFKIDWQAHKTLKSNKESEWQPLFNSIMLISKRYKNVDNGIEKVTIAVARPHSNSWKYLTTERSNIANKSKIVNLADYGLDVTSSRASAVVNYLDTFEQFNSQIIPTISTVNATGWRNDQTFIYPNTPGEIEIDDSINTQYNQVFQSAGNKETVIKLLIKHIKKLSVGFIIGATLAAPLIKIFKAQNIAIHLYSKAGTGKSTLIKLAFSLFGDPNANGSIPTFESTKAGREYFFNSRHDLPAIIDDLDSADDEKTKKINRELPYQFCNIAGRLRANKTGGNQKMVEYRGVLITNGETPLTSDNSKAGSKRRLIEFSPEFDIFNEEEVREVLSVINVNYGLFGRDWINFITEHQKEMINAFTRLTTGEKSIFKDTRFKNKVPYHINNLAVIAVAYQFFVQYFLGFNENEAEIWRRIVIIGGLSPQLPDNKSIADFERAKNYIRDWIFIHSKNFDTDFDAAKGFDRYGIRKNDYIAVIPSMLNQMLEDNGFNSQMVIQQLADDGFIRRESKRNITRKVQIGNSKSRLYCIPLNQINCAENKTQTE